MTFKFDAMIVGQLKVYLLNAAMAVVLVGSTMHSVAEAALVTNPGSSIVGQIHVAPVIVSNDDGTNTASFFGGVADKIAIESAVDQIWSQAGLRVRWSDPIAWNSTFANIGDDPPNTTRPRGDLSVIDDLAVVEGVASNDPTTLTMYFVRISPGHASLSPLSVAGLAQINESASTMFVGESLIGFESGGDSIGNDLIAKTVAHEIGHNLGLQHIGGNENLMAVGGGFDPVFARLDQQQIATTLASSFVVAVPEPGCGFAVAMTVAAVWGARRRRDGYRRSV